MEMPNLNVNQPSPIKKSAIGKYWPFILGAFLVVLAGVGSAWMISGKLMKRTPVSNGGAPGAQVSANEAGMLDPKVKYDNATGILKEGGLNNEGTHHLETAGGASHWVYMTSSVIDLQSFVGKKVEVWGQTLASKKVGWLMDVAKVQLQP